MKLKHIITILVFTLLQNLVAQNLGANALDNFNSNFISDPSIHEKDTGKLTLEFENTNFFKNDEYFGNLSSGLTYIGTFVRPKLVYQPYKKIKMSAGVHLLKYSGLESFSQAFPIFSIQYTPHKDIHFIMGSIYGAAQHDIIEPLFAFENHLIQNVENGVQLLLKKKKWSADIWLNWEKFILKTSNSQESILGGVHLDYILFGEAQKSNLKVDFQSIIAHRGGQFHKEEDVLQTLMNTATGLKYIKRMPSKHIRSIGANVHFVHFSDPSPIAQYPYLMGYAVATEGFINSKFVSLKIGYWSGEYFVSSRGNPLYMSVSEKTTSYVLPRTELITAKLAFKKQLYKDISFEARFEPYYDVQQGLLEYSYSIYMIFNRDFFLRKL